MLLKLIVIGFLTFIGTYTYVENSNIRGADTFALVATAIVCLIAFVYFRGTAKVVSGAISKASAVKDEVSTRLNAGNSDLYAIAEREINEGKADNGLWSQALVNVQGNEALRKVEYMKLRAKQLRRG